MKYIYFVFFALSFVVSFLATLVVARLAHMRQIVDEPDMGRHLHARPTPMLGGLAIYASFLLVTFVMGILGGFLLNGNIPLKLLIGIWVGGAILMVGGFLDDRYHLSAKLSIIFPVFASLVVVFSGVHAVSVHNPFTGNIIVLDQIRLIGIPLLSGLIVFVWTMIMTYTTKLLDGMDGLVSGISGIAALVLFGLSLSSQVLQPQTAMLAISLAGAMLGFLILNFYPAKIFLGESGSTFAGFMLAVLAIVSGGKMATTLLVMGIPLLDMLWVILQRLRRGQSPFIGDRKHLHYKLQEAGLSQPQAVLFLYALTGIFGVAALFLQSRGKLIALIILVLVMLAIVASILGIYKRRGKSLDK